MCIRDSNCTLPGTGACTLALGGAGNRRWAPVTPEIDRRPLGPRSQTSQDISGRAGPGVLDEGRSGQPLKVAARVGSKLVGSHDRAADNGRPREPGVGTAERPAPGEGGIPDAHQGGRVQARSDVGGSVFQAEQRRLDSDSADPDRAVGQQVHVARSEDDVAAVSHTNLEVYKRQGRDRWRRTGR